MDIYYPITESIPVANIISYTIPISIYDTKVDKNGLSARGRMPLPTSYTHIMSKREQKIERKKQLLGVRIIPLQNIIVVGY
jgi:hypothetical protein